ncbi:MAG: hypothetical protein IPN29_08985 [Saprospiraceae bacterium]|nr:hypothetical protein [Saprospiraceae bacterium]
MKRLLIFSFLWTALSCGNEVETIQADSQIMGKWIQRSSTLVEAKLERTSRFDTFDKGFTFFEDGTFIERSDGGICIGENCIMEDYYGTMEWLDADMIRLRVTNFRGPSDLTYTFQITPVQQLILLRK